MKNNIIGLHTFSVSSEIKEFTNKGIYRTVPAILYKINDEDINFFKIDRPIEIFKENMNYGKLRNIISSDDSVLTIPGKAYQKMMQYVSQNNNKVIADMLMNIIVKIINRLNTDCPDAHNVFFIDSIDMNKIIGRLGYLYIKSETNTIAFLTYKSKGLLTDTLNTGNEKVVFDIHYFDRTEHKKEEHSPIIPNDYMESLTQAVFYRIQSNETLSPLRCDVFSQGISTSQIQEKVDKLQEIFTDTNNMTPPFEDENGNYTMIPRVLNDCICAEKTYISLAKEILEVN